MEARAQLTEVQQDIYNFIIAFIRKNRYAPTIQEIRDQFNYSSINTAQNHVHNLVNKGYITYDAKKARTMMLVDDVVGNYNIDGDFLNNALKRLKDRGYKLDTNIAVEFLRELKVNIV